MQRPDDAEYLEYYRRYTSLVTEPDVVAALRDQVRLFRGLKMPKEGDGHRYAPDKWSIRQVIGHVADTERIFADRAFRILRRDPSPQPGFDENLYAETAGHDGRTLASLLDEFAAIRALNVDLLSRVSDEESRRSGIANGSPVTVRALAYIMLGHPRHHLRVLEERYGVGTP